MNNTFGTQIGKIYCAYNKDTDDFDKIRVVGKVDDKYEIVHLDENCQFIKDDYHRVTEEELNQIKKDCILLKSEGYVALTNVVSIKGNDNTKEIKDVLAIYFPNNKMTKVPHFNQPYIVARQGINNIFASMANEDVVGMAISLDTLPSGYALSDFMFNESVISSTMTHVYKTDTAKSLEILLTNSDTYDILESLYNHALQFRFNTIPGYNHETIADDCIGGYCNSTSRFLIESDFMGELYNKIGIVKVDFELKSNVPIEDEDKLLISTLCGGIRINKAVPIAFGYDVNINSIKMRYLLVSDINDKLWIVPYTESDNEIDAESVYNLTKDATLKLQERLKKVVKAYDKTTGVESVPVVSGNI